MAEETKNKQEEVPVKKNDGKLRRDTFRQSIKTSEYQRRHAKRRKERRKAAKEEKLRRRGHLRGTESEEKTQNADFNTSGAETAGENSGQASEKISVKKKVRRRRKSLKKAGEQTRRRVNNSPGTGTESAENTREGVKNTRQGVKSTPSAGKSVKNTPEGVKITPKDFPPETAVPTAAMVVPLAANNLIHRKVSEYEDDNVAVEAAHSGEKTAESTAMYATYHDRQKAKDKKKAAEKAEQKIAKKEEKTAEKRGDSTTDSTTKKQTGSTTGISAAEEAEGIFIRKSDHRPGKETDVSSQRDASRKLQRRKMQKEYAKAIRKGQTSQEAGKTAVRSVSGTFAELRNKVQEYATNNKGTMVSLGVLTLIVIIVINMMSSCGAMFQSAMSATMSAAYLSLPDDLDQAEVYLTEKEMKLQTKIDNIETTYPGYDEYDYNLGTIGHNPFTLLNYLSAKYTEFTFDEVKSEIDDLFADMYTLTRTEVTETRTREVQAKDEGGNLLFDADGNPVMTTEEYQVRILRVTLISASLDILVAGRMDDEQKDIYKVYQDSKGLLQQFATPVDYYWYLYVSSYYGYRKNPTTKAEEFHRGLDISIPAGSKVYAGHDGTVTTVGYDSVYGRYVVIDDSDGYTTKYAFLDTATVSQGTIVTAGQQIGKSGSTGSAIGSQLHIECLRNGTHYNPLLYFDAGEETLYGEDATGTGPSIGGFGAGGSIPPDAYDDPTVQRLFEEAVKYIGYPYVWGGSSPSTSFDCSGFVSWVYSASGVHPMGRMTAQGIYNSAVVISPAEAKAGDMIVFTGTYDSAGPVSHIGLYCGNGTMLHAGNPIGYANINTPYWQQHFYAFIRWP